MTDQCDRIVDEWLSAVVRAASDLAPHRRSELVADLREHIAAARADLRPETEAAVRTILERLGDPEAIAAEARYGEPGPPTTGRAAAHGAPGAGVPAAAPGGPPPGADGDGLGSRTPRWLVATLAAIAALCLLGCLLGVLGLLGFRTLGSVDSGTEPGAPVPAPTPSVTPGR